MSELRALITTVAVWLTGILGLLLQNLVPRWLFHHVPQETIYDQIDRVARENLKAARTAASFLRTLTVVSFWS